MAPQQDSERLSDFNSPPFDFDNAPVVATSPPILPVGGQRTSRLPLTLSIAALVIALATAAWVGLRSPLGAGISAYDFTTPAKALDSSLAIQMSGDIRAMLELERLKAGRRTKEKRDTLKVHRDADYQGKKILFISFKENGIPKHDTDAFEKDAETGLWFPTFVSTYSMNNDAPLKLAIEAWERKAAE